MEAITALQQASRFAEEREPFSAAARRPGSVCAPLTFAQQRAWELDRLAPNKGEHNISLTMSAPGAVDPEALEAAIHAVVEKHESLRTIFPDKLGVPQQLVADLPQNRPILARLATSEANLARDLAQVTRLPFDLATVMPLRAYLFTVGRDAHLIALALPRIAMDAWSVRPIVSDLMRIYMAPRDGGPCRLPTLPLQYVDYALSQRQRLGDETDEDSLISAQLAFWERAMDGLPDPAGPRGHASAGPSGGYQTQTLPVRINPALHHRLLLVARKSRASLFMVLHTGLVAALAESGAGKDIAIGTVVSGREPRFTRLVGLFENVLVLRSTVSGNPGFRSLLERVRECDLNALACQDVPFACVMDRLTSGDPTFAHRAPFQAMIVLRDESAAGRNIPGFSTSLKPGSSCRVQAPLVFDLVERYTDDGLPDGIGGEIEYDAGFYGRDEMEALAGRLIAQFHAAGNDTNRLSSGSGSVPAEDTAAEAAISLTRAEIAADDQRSDYGFYIPPSDILQDQLLKIWEDLLDVRPIGIWDDFFALGGSHELGSRMLDRVEDICGRKIPRSVISGSVSVQGLADALLATVTSSVVLMRKEGDTKTKRPLFYLHGDLSGGGFYTLELSRALAEDQPFIVLQQHGLDGRSVPASLEEMAEDHLETILSIQPEGPYYLGGHCNGGLLAFELARRLEGQGKAVKALIMIDPPYCAPGEALPPLPEHEPMMSANPRVRSSWIFSQYTRPILSYKLHRLSSKITLFWARHYSFPGEHPREFFGQFAADVDFQTISGDHISCLGRHVRQAGAQIDACLSQACGLGQ